MVYGRGFDSRRLHHLTWLVVAPGRPHLGCMTLHPEALRQNLLALHRAIVAFEREGYERRAGRVPAAEFLRMLVEDQTYAWLRPLSQLIVRIDDEEAEAVSLAEIGALLRPDATGTPLQQRYAWLIDASPDVAYAHGEVMRTLKGYRRDPAAAVH